MIIEILANSNPMNLAGMWGTSTAQVRAFALEVEAEFCTGECEHIELAFYDNASTEQYRNDRTSFLVRKGATSETWAFQLWKDGVFKATISSAALGQYFDFASIPGYADLKGVILEWKLIAAAHGNGLYTFRAVRTFSGDDTIFESHMFRCMPYSFEAAKGTVRIETYQNGTFVSTGRTYRGMNWYESIRVVGRFWNKQPKLETDEYLDSDRQRTQIWDKIVNTYDMELPALPAKISNLIIYDKALANRIQITDYNVGNEVYRQVPVRIKDISQAEYGNMTERGFFQLQFTDQSEGTIKGR